MKREMWPLSQLHQGTHGPSKRFTSENVLKTNHQLFRSKNKSSVSVSAVPVPKEIQNTPIFSEFQEEYNTSKSGKECRKVISKRKCTAAPAPQSVKHLKRSARMDKVNHGYKSDSVGIMLGPVTRSKTKNKKVASCATLTGNIFLAVTEAQIEFPGLSDLEEAANKGIKFPEIPVIEIQKIATEKCRISPSEVTAELLLASRNNEVNNGEGSSGATSAVVING